MFYRIFAQKDTYITNEKLNNVQRTGSNFGSSEILHIHKLTGMSGAVGVAASSSYARILTKFDLTGITSLTASGDAPSTGLQYYLRLCDARHDKTLPSSFDIEVQAVSQDWDEGKGRDVDTFRDLGVANWDKAKSDVWWSVPGASGSGVIAKTHFDVGSEDMEVNVTEIVEQWLSGTLTNYGFLVKLSSSQEANSQDYFVKMFHGRETFFKDRRPHLEVRWDDSLTDDRNNFFFDASGSLFLYHRVRGTLQNISGIGTGSIGVRIVDASGTITTVTGSYVKTGIYSASFAIPTGSYSGSLFRDIWFRLGSPSSWHMTGSFGISGEPDEQDLKPKTYFVSLTNLKDCYDSTEVVRINMYARPHDYNPAQVLTSSVNPYGLVITDGYYRIINDRTDEVVVPYSTGSLKYTRLSYDRNGNYLKLYMSSLSTGNIYRISFLFNVDGQSQHIDQGFKFKVS